MKTHVYIDGFNLYYGAIKGTKLHWLDLLKLSRSLFPEFQIERVWYFTAMVSGRKDDLNKPLRQQAYINALRTFPEVIVQLGQYVTHKKILPLVEPLSALRPRAEFAQVLRTDEKGSDVNLAVRLLHEAHQNMFDVGIVISNDSDLVEPIRIVRKELHKTIGVVNPHKYPSKELVANADFVRQIREGLLEKCLLPLSCTNASGKTYHCPDKWRV